MQRSLQLHVGRGLHGTRTRRALRTCGPRLLLAIKWVIAIPVVLTDGLDPRLDQGPAVCEADPTARLRTIQVDFNLGLPAALQTPGGAVAASLARWQALLVTFSHASLHQLLGTIAQALFARARGDDIGVRRAAVLNDIAVILALDCALLRALLRGRRLFATL